MKLCCFWCDEESEAAASPARNPNGTIGPGQPTGFSGEPNSNAGEALQVEQTSASHNSTSDQISPSTAIPAGSGPGPSKSPTQQNGSISSISEDVWDEAYEGVRKDSSALVENYEEIVEYEIKRQDAAEGAGQTLITAYTTNTLPDADPKLRRQQMKALVKSRIERADGRNTAKQIANETMQVLQKFKEQIGSALSVYPPAGLAWLGVTFLLERALVSVEASLVNIDGLGYVITRLNWYMGLCRLLLRDSWDVQGEIAVAFEDVRKNIRDRIVDLYKSLLEYQIKSVCAYYRFNRIFTFLKDQVQLNDWKGQVTGIKESENALFRDVDCYNQQISLELQRQHAQFIGEVSHLVRQLMESELQKEERRHGDRINKMPYAEDAAYNARVWEQVDIITECLPDTRVDILRDIMAWVGSEDKERIFWLNGMAGTGKSTIARTISRRCDKQGLLGASFFFSSRHGSKIRDATSFVPTLAVQLSKKSARLKRFIGEAREADEGICSQFIRDQWTKLIFKPLQLLADESCPVPWVLVVDAMDECQGEDDIQIILQLFLEAATEKGLPLKIIVTSRPSIRGLFKAMPKESCRVLVVEDVPRSIVDKDIELLFTHQFSKIRQSSGALPLDWPGEKKIDRLVRKADGLFIYAATMCRFILQHTRAKTWAPQVLLNIFLPDVDDSNSTIQPLEHRDSDLPQASPTAELDEIYMRIINHSISTLDNEQDKRSIAKSFRRIAGSLALLYDPLSATELSCLLELRQEIVDLRLEGLCSILHVPEDKQSPVRLLHSSFRDFLLDPRRCVNRLFLIDEKEGHKTLAEGSVALMLKDLQKDMCRLGDPGTLTSEIESGRVSQHLPRVLQYACRYWIQHVQSSGRSLCDHDEIYKFLQKHLLHWLEAQSLTGNLPECIFGILNLKSNVSVDANRLMYEMLHDTWRFLLNNRTTIEEAPLQVYNSSIIFAPNFSVIRQLGHDPIPTWLQITPGIEDNWGPSLQTLQTPDESDSVAFSPAGELIASACYGAVSLWNSTTGTSRGVLEADSADTVVFSPNGKLIAACGLNKSARIWDVTTMALRDVIEGHKGWISAISFSIDSLFLATGSWDSDVRIFDITERKCCSVLVGHNDLVVAVVFLSDNQRLASASHDGTVKLWNPFTEELLCTLSGPPKPIRQMVLAPDGGLLACGSADSVVYVWDTSTRARKWTLKGHSAEVRALAFSENGLLVSGSDDNTAILWDVKTGQPLAVLPNHSQGVATVAFSRPMGNLLASGSYDGRVRLWDGHTGAYRGVFQGHNHFVHDLEFSTKGLLASASADGTVRLWDTEAAGTTGSDSQCHMATITQIVFSPDGLIVASSSWDTTVKLWDARTGALRHTLQCSDAVFQIVFSRNSLFLASRSDTIRLWNARTGDLVVKSSDTYTVGSFFFTSDNQILGSISAKSVYAWDTDKGEEFMFPTAHRCEHTTFTISPDGQIYAWALENGSICVWHIKRSGGPIEEPWVLASGRDEHSDYNIQEICISPNCQYLAAASADSTISLWDLKSKLCLKMLREHSSSIRTLVFSPDGQLLASGSEDASVRIWDVTAVKCVGVLEGHLDSPGVICFSPNSKILASSSEDALRLWDVENKTSLQTINPGTYLRELQFSEDSSCLFTEYGAVEVALPRHSPPTVPQGKSHNIFVCGSWVLQRGRRILRLSPDYDQTCRAAKGPILAGPHVSGRIALLDFSRAPTT